MLGDKVSLRTPSTSRLEQTTKATCFKKPEIRREKAEGLGKTVEPGSPDCHQVSLESSGKLRSITMDLPGSD